VLYRETGVIFNDFAGTFHVKSGLGGKGAIVGVNGGGG
jgi:hypothetical protein